MVDATTVLVTATYSEDLLAAMRERAPDFRFVQLPQSGEVPKDGRDARILLRCFMSKDQLRQTLRSAPDIEWIHTCTAGFDQLIVPEIVDLGLKVTRSAATTHIPISEWVMACILFMAKEFPLLIDAQSKRQWAEPNPQELHGSTIGILGAGAIGTEVARRAAAFGMHVIGTKRSPMPVECFDEVWSDSETERVLELADYVVVSCPLTEETRSLIGLEQLRKMKPTAYLVNIARGAIVVEEDLAVALREGALAGAALDVFTEEPLPSDSLLWDVPRLLVTPHSSFRSPASGERGLEEFLRNLARFTRGEPLENPLKDPTLGY
jgi:phosphoglycerate dehydrogenase-like enzyme